MAEAATKLFLFCGKPASGKSTLAHRLAGSDRTVVIAEDAWLAALFSDQMSAISDYVRCSGKLRDIMGPHIISLLRAGTSVVLDYPANTLKARAWMQGLAKSANAIGELHYLDVPDDTCKARLRKRNDAGEHPFQLTDAQFDELCSHFVVPTDDEGFQIIVHHQA
ncbi:AAA family ATPase [Ruegeria profundi]|uniref:AAA family ATPase n=1 Tax=Ruegeria profundi TaxID=1685378 RepID=UPI001CD4AB3C|nr:ATP-binding protein [Ruegeria profundi]MCA0928479.1 ATP-binding protein [Ruegeria profundi]